MKLALMTGGEAGSNSRIHSNPARPRLILASPIAIILLGQLAAHTAGPAISVWSWIPLHIGYWIAILFLTGWGGGRESVVRWLRPSRGKRVWAFLAVAISVLLALPMISPDNLTLFLADSLFYDHQPLRGGRVLAGHAFGCGRDQEGMAGSALFKHTFHDQSFMDLGHGDRRPEPCRIYLPICVRARDVRDLSKDAEPALAFGRALFDQSAHPDGGRLSPSVYSGRAVAFIVTLPSMSNASRMRMHEIHSPDAGLNRFHHVPCPVNYSQEEDICSSRIPDHLFSFLLSR